MIFINLIDLIDFIDFIIDFIDFIIDLLIYIYFHIIQAWPARLLSPYRARDISKDLFAR